MAREPWYDPDNPGRVARGVSWRAAVAVIVAVLFMGAIATAIWAFRTGTSDIKGRGDAVQTKNAAGNRIAAQEQFEKLCAGIVAADKRIAVLAAAQRADPADVVAKTNYVGAINYCLGVVADYNAAARSYTSEQFRASDLPYQIDDTDPKTDCQETKETPR